MHLAKTTRLIGFALPKTSFLQFSSIFVSRRFQSTTSNEVPNYFTTEQAASQTQDYLRKQLITSIEKGGKDEVFSVWNSSTQKTQPDIESFSIMIDYASKNLFIPELGKIIRQYKALGQQLTPSMYNSIMSAYSHAAVLEIEKEDNLLGTGKD